jgi:MerR family transcriptional regulator, copper efflux regulator
MSSDLLKSLDLGNPQIESMTDQSVLIIGELARIVGMEPKTIRFYERVGLVSPARQGKFRLFRKADAERLTVVRALRSLGVPIRTIKVLLAPSETDEGGRPADQIDDILKSHFGDLTRRREELNMNISVMARLLKVDGEIDKVDQ